MFTTQVDTLDTQHRMHKYYIGYQHIAINHVMLRALK